MGRPKKAKTQPQPEKQQQTLLFIKPKPPEESIAETITEPIAEPTKQPTAEPIVKPTTKPVIKPKLQKLPDIEVKPATIESTEIPTEIPTEQQEALASSSMFQAVGVIAGTIRLDENGKAFINVGAKEYPLYYVSGKTKRKAYDALMKEIEATDKYYQRLIVYPRILHFPRKEQPHNISFQVIGFESPRTEGGIAKELQDFEFKLCGLWQFIPVCQTPCITVQRNFTSERLDYIKKEETSALSKVKFMKASHVPVIWRDAPVKPFRFNPKIPKEQQGHASFVEIKAKFLPNRDVFGFEELLSTPSDQPPRFFKARKEDKAEALKIKREIIASRK